MPPLAPPPSHGGEKSSSSGSGGRQRHGHGMAAQHQQRAASFHGRGTEQRHQPQQKPRPKTMPDLLAGVTGAQSLRSGTGSPHPYGDADADAGRRTPSKVLVSVAVQQSMWPLHVMASAEWTVADLVAAAVGLYVKEGRRPPLPSTDPAAFGLHYSQFSLESLNPKEKIMELGSRSFFLCPRSSAAGQQDASSSSPVTANGVIRAASGKTPAWLSNMPFWPTM